MSDLNRSKYEKNNNDDTMEILDHAIDEWDIDKVDGILEYLSKEVPIKAEIEDSRIFAKRIASLSEGGVKRMKFMRKRSMVLVATLTILTVLCVTIAFGSGVLKFDFYNDENTVQIKTSENLSEDEINRLAQDSAENYENNIVNESIEVVKPDNLVYKSIAETESGTGYSIVVPSYIPNGFLLEKSISVSEYGSETIIYLGYINESIEEKFLGVTLKFEEPIEGTSVSVTDAVYSGNYVSASGREYTLLDEDGAKVVMTDVGILQYAIISMGFDDEELYRIIDSIDLKAYEN